MRDRSQASLIRSFIILHSSFLRPKVHEFAIAQQVLKIIEEKSGEHGDARVRSVRLRIGELSGVNADCLRFALEACAQDTRAEGMAVEFIRVPAKLRCRSCSLESEFDAGNLKCPGCGSLETVLEGGDDLYVESFELG